MIMSYSISFSDYTLFQLSISIISLISNHLFSCHPRYTHTHTHIHTHTQVKTHRRLGHDSSLPFPNSIHELGHYALRTHEFSRYLADKEDDKRKCKR